MENRKYFPSNTKQIQWQNKKRKPINLPNKVNAQLSTPRALKMPQEYFRSLNYYFFLLSHPTKRIYWRGSTIKTRAYFGLRAQTHSFRSIQFSSSSQIFPQHILNGASTSDSLIVFEHHRRHPWWENEPPLAFYDLNKWYSIYCFPRIFFLFLRGGGGEGYNTFSSFRRRGMGWGNR